MKKFMSRNHADFLKRQYMSIDLDHDVVVGLHNRQALSHKAFSRQDQPQDQPIFPASLERCNGRLTGRMAS
jgi:hypothetical protein